MLTVAATVDGRPLPRLALAGWDELRVAVADITESWVGEHPPGLVRCLRFAERYGGAPGTRWTWTGARLAIEARTS